jgi:hypothetical protein
LLVLVVLAAGASLAAGQGPMKPDRFVEIVYNSLTEK